MCRKIKENNDNALQMHIFFCVWLDLYLLDILIHNGSWLPISYKICLDSFFCLLRIYNDKILCVYTWRIIRKKCTIQQNMLLNWLYWSIKVWFGKYPNPWGPIGINIFKNLIWYKHNIIFRHWYEKLRNKTYFFSFSFFNCFYLTT